MLKYAVYGGANGSDLNINEPWVSTKEIAEHLGIAMETIRK